MLNSDKIKFSTDFSTAVYSGGDSYIYMSTVSSLFVRKEHCIKIYNATREGDLEFFERRDFDSLF